MFVWKFLAKFPQNIIYNLLINHNFDRLTRRSNHHQKEESHRGNSPERLLSSTAAHTQRFFHHFITQQLKAD